MPETEKNSRYVTIKGAGGDSPAQVVEVNDSREYDDTVIVPAVEPDAIEGRLRKAPLRVPEVYDECVGFTLFGRKIRSLLYSTDVAVIRNSNADAVFAVYPFTAQPAITQALLAVAEAPLFVGVGGGTTGGRRAAELAAVSEMQGAAGVVLNSPAPAELVEQVGSIVDIPVIATITDFDQVAKDKVSAGARIVNVAAGARTAEVIRELRAAYPTLPIIATGGRDDESARQAIAAGANALIWAPPSIGELQRDMMARYRSGECGHAEPAQDASAVPVADVPNGEVSNVPPEVAVEPVVEEEFVSPFRGRLPHLLFRNRRA